MRRRPGRCPRGRAPCRYRCVQAGARPRCPWRRRRGGSPPEARLVAFGQPHDARAVCLRALFGQSGNNARPTAPKRVLVELPPAQRRRGRREPTHPSLAEASGNTAMGNRAGFTKSAASDWTSISLQELRLVILLLHAVVVTEPLSSIQPLSAQAVQPAKPACLYPSHRVS